MKKILPILLIAFSLVSFSTNVSAQGKVSKGEMTLKITGASAEDENMNAMLGFIKNTETVVTFNELKTLVMVNAMGGMINTKMLYTKGKDKVLMLMDAMGNKIGTEMDNPGMTDESKESAKKLEFEIDKNTIETIAGFKSYKVTVKDPSNPGLKMIAFCTNEISVDANYIQQMNTSGFPGTPTKYTISVDGLTLTTELVSFKKDIDLSVLDLTTDGYKMMDQEQFQKNLGGAAGGMGF